MTKSIAAVGNENAPLPELIVLAYVLIVLNIAHTCSDSLVLTRLIQLGGQANLCLYGEKIRGGSLYDSGKLPTYPSPEPTLTPKVARLGGVTVLAGSSFCF